jgi:hypothetical protein
MKLDGKIINPLILRNNLEWNRFTSFEFYDEMDSPMLVTDGDRVEVFEYLDGFDGTGRPNHDPIWAMKGDEFGASEISNPMYFIRERDVIDSIKDNFCWGLVPTYV